MKRPWTSCQRQLGRELPAPTVSPSSSAVSCARSTDSPAAELGDLAILGEPGRGRDNWDSLPRSTPTMACHGGTVMKPPGGQVAARPGVGVCPCLWIPAGVPGQGLGGTSGPFLQGEGTHTSFLAACLPTWTRVPCFLLPRPLCMDASQLGLWDAQGCRSGSLCRRCHPDAGSGPARLLPAQSPGARSCDAQSLQGDTRPGQPGPAGATICSRLCLLLRACRVLSPHFPPLSTWEL